MKTQIRYATAADFPALLTIDKTSFPREIAYDVVELRYLMTRPGAETLVLEEENVIVAFLLLEVNRRRKRATLVTIDVLTDKRRKGYATQLLNYAEKNLQDSNIDTVDLQVDMRNDPALKFYRMHGFQVEKRLQKYYPGGHDAWQMIKKLPASSSV